MLSRDEKKAVKACLEAGRRFGYGNMISHLRRAWALKLIALGLSEQSAIRGALSDPYSLDPKKYKDLTGLG